MNPQDTLMLLAAGSLLDARLGGGSDADKIGKALAWSVALDDDIPAEWARIAVAKHYAETTTTVMPADLNKAWRDHCKAVKAREREQRTRLELQRTAAEAVPMPDYVRVKLESLKNKWALPEEAMQ